MRGSFRLRVLAMFAALAAGAIGAVGAGIALGSARPDSGFLMAFVVSAFLLLGLCTLFWWLFDTNVARPLERLAAELRVRAHSGATTTLDLSAARYLGDLAPAADAVTRALGDGALATAEAVAAETRNLEAERARLTALLTEIPVATILVNADDRIVLYDGQAAEVLAQMAPPRLGARLSEYFEAGPLRAVRAEIDRSGLAASAKLPARGGAQTFAAQLKPMDGGGYLLVIDAEETTLDPSAARPIVYDFALSDRSGDGGAVADQRLSDLTYCVFDTETTGLLPHRDEIVQIGAVRVLNGRIVPGERFETLVDPGRPIPEGATRVHGISDRMVAGAPRILQAARRFHDFATGAVIVAHNAPFDMAFLRRHAAEGGLVWDHPILDTVLLSAVLFGTTERHTLDALAERLGVAVPAAGRHTAMGDAEVTAQVLLRMIAMLEGRGIDTFGALIAETRRHGRLLEDLN
ncbi:DNA polymerase III PolC-type [Roseivivax jejudonensis]|uniref:DNA-directed DNA polymerase n=1 Tax=Roseivivax jejudonensis TaxID=1529041 RepID=A0A1X6Z205_9RHOB|nr:3'-5' exonuclease [Roseivivax jejudonensis]SLN37613.1 DNA polymerase III PolC-type [Roseivivax jejudonensis]